MPDCDGQTDTLYTSGENFYCALHNYADVQ